MFQLSDLQRAGIGKCLGWLGRSGKAVHKLRMGWKDKQKNCAKGVKHLLGENETDFYIVMSDFWVSKRIFFEFFQGENFNFRKRSLEKEQSKRNKGNSSLIINIFIFIDERKTFSFDSCLYYLYKL